MKSIYSIFFLCFNLCVCIVELQAQQYIDESSIIELHWQQKDKLFSFDNAVLQSEYLGLPKFSKTIKSKTKNDFTVEIVEPSYTPIAANSFSKEQIQLLSSQLQIQQSVGVDRKQFVTTISFLPYTYKDGQVLQLQSFKLKTLPVLTSASREINISSRTYVSNSMLQNGKWFMFGVPNNGVYKLDYSFLKKLGIAVDNIHPNNIRIFGHRGGMLPELAGADKDDDLREFPLKVVTSSPNVFGSNDYVLVYLPGPESWTYNTTKQMFVAKKHTYSDTKNFFITTDAGVGSRMTAINGISLPETNTVNTYNDYAFIEDDRTNLAHSGRVFVGDEFGGVTERSYAFSFPNLLSGQPVKLDISVVAAADVNGSYFNVSTDGAANANSIYIPRVDDFLGIKDVAERQERQLNLFNVPTNFNVHLSFDRNGDFNTKGWLDYLQANAVSILRYNNQALYFRNISSVGIGNVSKFEIQNMNANVEIWDVTNPFATKKINYQLSNNIAVFTLATDSLREFVAIENTNNVPIAFGSIANQNLHAMPQQDMLIVTRNAMLPQAQELAQFHRDKQGLNVAVVELNQIYNEFSSGTNDISAIRDFVKMFYDRAAGDSALMPKYLLLFGDGTYNNKSLHDYLLPCYQSQASFESLQTYVSDDYFGLMDDNEGANINNTAAEIMDVAVGRIPADDFTKAQTAVEKIKRYYVNAAYGDWRNQGTFVADDEDRNIHIADANDIADSYAAQVKKINIDKIYLDAYQQQSSTGVASYPAVNDAINRKLFTGTLFLNYIGHGGALGLAKERILTAVDIDQWENQNKLPLFITATCEFAPYDKVDENSAGERVLFKPNGGGIALVTTTRVVYSHTNKTMNTNFMTQMKNASVNSSVNLGDIIREAKKYTNTADGNRKFTLLGDPAIRLAFPTYQVKATSINNQAFSSPHDTLKALSKITIEGEVQDNNNQLFNTFNGTTSIVIFDKSKTINTLVNDPVSINNPDGSLPYDFTLQKNTIYKGKTKVTDGKFKFTFLVPKDIDYSYGFGKMSMYASADTTDASGYTSDIVVGGAYDTLLTDNEGPDVDVFLNDDKFVFGGITDESPKLFAKLKDENGINTSGNSVGHDITAIIDNNTQRIYNLNDFYENELDDITQGKVTFPFSGLAKGRHTLEVKAWDVLNNSGIGYTEFIVEEKANLALSHVLNYPNPFTTNTKFMFEHNKPGASLDLKIEIFSVSGKIIKTITKNINSAGYRVDDVSWDGLDDYGDKIGKGVYIYRVSLKDDSGKKVSQYQKLVVLN